MLDFIGRLSARYPDTYILPNRPMHALVSGWNPRMDDFRAFSNGFFWESFLQDVIYVFPDTLGQQYVDIVRSVADDSDGSGLTVLPIDYRDIALEGVDRWIKYGQGAPYIDSYEQYLSLCHTLGFVCTLAPDRLLYRMPEVPVMQIVPFLEDTDNDGILDVVDLDADDSGVMDRLENS